MDLKGGNTRVFLARNLLIIVGRSPTQRLIRFRQSNQSKAEMNGRLNFLNFDCAAPI